MRVCLLTGPSPACNHLHRAAATLDAESTITSTLALKDWPKLLETPPEARPDLVAIAAPVDITALQAMTGAGLHLLLEAPPLEPRAAEDLARTAKQSGSILTIAWLDTAYPMARAGMTLLRDRKLGQVHSVCIEHLQPRTASTAGTHAVTTLAPSAECLLSTVTGLKLRALCADAALNPASRAHDDVGILLRFEGHTRGHMTLSRTAPHTSLALRVHGELATLEWSSHSPSRLAFTPTGKPTQVWTPVHAESGPLAGEAARNTAGNEGATEALANLYRAALESIRAKREGRARKALGREFPTTTDLTRAARFTAAALESTRAGGVWVEL